jgi:hypothetical protein
LNSRQKVRRGIGLLLLAGTEGQLVDRVCAERWAHALGW